MPRLHCLQHVPFEGPANIAAWAEQRGWPAAGTALYDGVAPPAVDTYDWLVVMGGPMSVGDGAEYPWLAAEKTCIGQAIDAGKVVIGVCLGAQLIADVMGAKVAPNRWTEIGWFETQLTDAASQSTAFAGLPNRFTAYHWHGDTFALPDGCMHTARSAACENQAFEYEGRVVGLQFHIESTAASIEALITNCADEIVPGEYVQSAEVMRGATGHLEGLPPLLNRMLDNLAAANPL